MIPFFWQVFCCLHFSLNLHYCFSIFFPTNIAKLKKIETKKTWWLGGRSINPTIETQIFTKFNCVSFYKKIKCKIYFYIILKKML